MTKEKHLIKPETSSNSNQAIPIDDDFPDLAGLPEVSSAFCRECLLAGEKGFGVLYTHLLKDRHRFVNETNDHICFVVLDPSTGHGVWRTDHHGLAAEKDVELVALVFLREAHAVRKKIQSLAGDDSRKDELNRLTELRKALLKAVDKLRTEKGLRATIRFALPYISISADKLDQHPFMLVFSNCTILIDQAARSKIGAPSDLCTRCCSCEWSGLDHQDSLLEKVSLEIHSDNQAENEYFWRWLGTALTGESTMQEFLVLSGPGRNGKGVLLGSIMHAMGSYARPIKSEMLLDQKHSRSADAPSPSTLSLKGLRLAVASENDEGRRFSTAAVKWLTGDDELVGRAILGRDDVYFKPTHSLVLMTNAKPKAPPDDYAFWERMKLIEYRQRYTKNRAPNPALGELPADSGLKDKLKSAAPAVMVRLVRGYLEFVRDGHLNTPPSVQAATAAYQKREDLVKQWLDERCEFGDDYFIRAAAAHEDFKKWYAETISEDWKPMGPKHFAGQLIRFLNKDNDSANCRIYRGARIAD